MSNSAAGRFRELLNRPKEDQETFQVTSPSEMVWTLRRPNLEKFLMSGLIPTGLSNKLQSAKSKGIEADKVFDSLSADQREKMLNFSRELIKDICVSPRVVDVVQDEENEISLVELAASPEDYKFLNEWAEKQVSGGEVLDSFRK